MKKQTKPSKVESTSSPWDAMDAIMRSNPEPIGPEWFTANQFGLRYGYDVDVAAMKLNRMHKKGLLEKWAGISITLRRKTVKYRLK
jgi:hypothetical protein